MIETRRLKNVVIYIQMSGINTPSNHIKLNATECFQDNNLAPTEHAKNWLGSIILKCLSQTMKMLMTAV